MRNSKGQFIEGHKALCFQDKKTGQFKAKKLTDSDKSHYLEVREQVDKFLSEYEVGC